MPGDEDLDTPLSGELPVDDSGDVFFGLVEVVLPGVLLGEDELGREGVFDGAGVLSVVNGDLLSFVGELGLLSFVGELDLLAVEFLGERPFPLEGLCFSGVLLLLPLSGVSLPGADDVLVGDP